MSVYVDFETWDRLVVRGDMTRYDSHKIYVEDEYIGSMDYGTGQMSFVGYPDLYGYSVPSTTVWVPKDVLTRYGPVLPGNTYKITVVMNGNEVNNTYYTIGSDTSIPNGGDVCINGIDVTKKGDLNTGEYYRVVLDVEEASTHIFVMQKRLLDKDGIELGVESFEYDSALGSYTDTDTYDSEVFSVEYSVTDVIEGSNTLYHRMGYTAYIEETLELKLNEDFNIYNMQYEHLETLGEHSFTVSIPSGTDSVRVKDLDNNVLDTFVDEDGDGKVNVRVSDSINDVVLYVYNTSTFEYGPDVKIDYLDEIFVKEFRQYIEFDQYVIESVLKDDVDEGSVEIVFDEGDGEIDTIPYSNKVMREVDEGFYGNGFTFIRNNEGSIKLFDLTVQFSSKEPGIQGVSVVEVLSGEVELNVHLLNGSIEFVLFDDEGNYYAYKHREGNKYKVTDLDSETNYELTMKSSLGDTFKLSFSTVKEVVEDEWKSYVRNKYPDSKVTDMEINLLVKGIRAYVSKRTGLDKEDFDDDLEFVVMTMVKNTLNRHEGLDSKSFGDVNFSFDKELPEFIQEVLSNYNQAEVYYYPNRRNGGVWGW